MARKATRTEIAEHKRLAKSGKPIRIFDAALAGTAGAFYAGVAGDVAGRIGAEKFIIRRMQESGKFRIHPIDLDLIKGKPGVAERFAKALLKSKKVSKEGLRTSEAVIRKLIATGAKRGGIVGAVSGAVALGGLSYALYPGKKRKSKKFIEEIAAGKRGNPKQQENVRNWMKKYKDAL